MNETYKDMISNMSNLKNLHPNDLDFKKRPELTKYANNIQENEALNITIKYLCAEYPNMVNLYRIRKSLSESCLICYEHKKIQIKEDDKHSIWECYAAINDDVCKETKSTILDLLKTHAAPNLTDNSIQISELVQFIINPNSENNPETFSDINNKKTEENDRKLMFLLFQKYLHDSHTARSKHLLQIYKKMPGLSKMKPLEQEVTLKINLI